MTERKPGEMQIYPSEGAYYQLGNDLRGYEHGNFDSDQEAWDVLSDRFNQRWPSRNGRSVVLVRSVAYGQTAGGNETESDRLAREELEEILRNEREGI